MTDQIAEPRPFIAATPLNGYVVHAIRQPHPDAARLNHLGDFWGTSICGIRGRDHTGWGGFRFFPRGTTTPFTEAVAPLGRGTANPICLTCLRKWKRITDQQAVTR